MKLTLTKITRFTGIAIVIAGIGFGCGKNDEEEARRTTDVSRTIEIVTSTIGASLDEFDLAATPHAFCADRAASQLCTGTSGNFVRSVNYTSCLPTFGSNSLIGSDTLTYNDPTTCQLDSAGDLLTRTQNLIYTLTDGTTLTATSGAMNNYQGVTVLGGTTVGRTSTLGAYQVQINGVNRKYMKAGAITASLSAKSATTSNLQFSPAAGTARANRVLNGGVVTVDHNTSSFTALISPINLSWISSCCHTQTGSINLTLSGSLTGSGTVVFPNSTCGSYNYSLTISGQTTTGTGQLAHCGG